MAARIRSHLPFLGLLGLVAAIRIATLIVSQRHVHSDEAIIGLMARHIRAGEALPVYFYGQAFNGGGALEAYLAAGSFAALGTGVTQLKLVVVVLSLASLALFYAFALRFWSRSVALLGALVYASAPTLVAWHYQVRGGYGEVHLFALAILYAAFAIAEGRARTPAYFALGFVSGIALWCFELILPTLLVAVAYLALGHPTVLRGRRGLVVGASFLLGYAPALGYNLATGGANWRALLEQRLAGGSGLAALFDPAALWRLLSFELPRFFGPDTILRYKPEAHVSGWIFYAVAALAVVHALWHYRDRHRALLVGLTRRGESRVRRDRESLLLAIAAASLVAYAVVPTRVPSYLLPIVPLLALLAGVWLDDLRRAAAPYGRAAAAFALALVCGAGLWESAQLLGRDRIESLAPQDGELVATSHSGETIRLAIEHLRARGIRAVFSSPSFQYPIIFESGEEILASSRALPWRYIVHHPYELAVVDAIRERPVFVIEHDSPYRERAEEVVRSLSTGAVVMTEVGELVVIEALPPSPWARGRKQ